MVVRSLPLRTFSALTCRSSRTWESEERRQGIWESIAESNPVLSQSSFVNIHTDVPTEVLATEFVPEPSMLSFASVASALLIVVHRFFWDARGCQFQLGPDAATHERRVCR